MRPRTPRTAAQALVEFALVAPIFFLLLFAIIDFGRYVYYVQILNNAAREGTRYAIVHGNEGFPLSGPGTSDPNGDNVKAVVRTYATGVISASDLNIEPRWPDGTGRGKTVSVHVTYQFRSVIPIVPLPPVAIRGESTLVINN